MQKKIITLIYNWFFFYKKIFINFFSLKLKFLFLEKNAIFIKFLNKNIATKKLLKYRRKKKDNKNKLDLKIEESKITSPKALKIKWNKEK